MPYPNEHAARIRDPGQFDKIRRENNKFGQGIHAIWGIKNNKSQLQAVRFDKSKFTVEEAKKWLEDNKITFIKFEPAGEEVLTHTGVLGMKWGVRKDRSTGQDNKLYRAKSPSSVAGTIAKRVGPHSFKAVYKPKPGDSEHHALFSAIRTKKVQDMTDNELKFVTDRTSLISLYKKSGAITKKKIRQMSNDELRGHADRYLLRKGILKNPVRRWKIKDFVKTYKLSDVEAKTLLDRVNAENRYYDAKDASINTARRYIKTFLDTNP